MSKGIIVFGAPGVGDTTLGKETARRLNCTHIDIDDYIWRWNVEIPYTALYSREERTERIMNAMMKYPRFVASGSMFSIRKTFEPFFSLAVFMTAPVEIRMERLRAREFALFGDRILAGGDMYEQNIRFLKEAEEYDIGESPQVCLKQHEQWAAELSCPVLRIDGTKEIDVNAAFIIEKFLSLKNE